MKGAIICGYPCIGKSTLSNAANGYIDLESSNFFVNGKRDDHWCEAYVNIALHLAWQGYKVFVSSHEDVIKLLSKHETDERAEKLLCFPSLDLEAAWVNKVTKRFCDTMSSKDSKAMAYVCANYKESIDKLKKQKGFRKVMITDMQYDLQSVIETIIEEETK